MARADDTDDVTADLTADVTAAGGAGETTVLRTLQSLGAVIGPTALITALLFYFGWAKAQAFSTFFGLDVSLFRLSTQDYLLQSIRSVFLPLGEVLIGGLLLLWAHRVVSAHIEARPDRRWWQPLTVGLAVVGMAAFVIGLVENANRHPSDTELVLTPLLLMLGVALVSYAVLIDRRRRQPRRTKAPPGGTTALPALNVILVATLIAVGLVWTVADYADIKGRQEAEFVLDQLEFQPTVVVYSAKSLQIGAPGVKETRFTTPDSAYGFRYDGLKLLFQSNGRYFLVPASWSVSDGTTVVLDENDTLRLEFVRPPE